jgi:L-ribulose-5-phosphate 3-epimerase
VAAHLKETVPGVFRDLFYGEGRVDFPAVVSTLWDMGVRRFNAEFWHNGTDRVDERLSAASAYLREILDQKGRRQA